MIDLRALLPGRAAPAFNEETIFLAGKPFEGYRLWNACYRHDLAVLTSIWMNVRWPARRALVAHCYVREGVTATLRRGWATGRHECPARPGFGQCGIYAVREGRTNTWMSTAGATRGRTVVWGRVALWGRIICGENGYRAQFAYPQELYVLQVAGDGDPGVLAHDLEARYGVPCAVALRHEDT